MVKTIECSDEQRARKLARENLMCASTMSPPKPPDEEARLAALREYEILDTDPEIGFEDLTLLASSICDVPISTVTLIDTDRQWFKSRIGVETSETPLEHSFCAYAIL